MKPMKFKIALDKFTSVPVIMEAREKSVLKYLMYRGFAPKFVSSLFSWIRVVLPSSIAEDIVDILGIERYYVDYQMNILGTRVIETEKSNILPISFTTSALNLDKLYNITHEAYRLHITGKSVKVGVIDTGANAVFKKSIKTEASNLMGRFDFNGHGTHVASTIGAPFNSPKYGDIDMHGVAPDSKLYVYNAMPIGAGSTSEILHGIDVLYRMGVRIFNMSLGMDIDSDYDYCEDAFTQFIDKLVAHDPNVLFVVASGNSGAGNLSTPAISPHVLSVGSLSYTDDDVAWFSSYGDIEIPGYGTRRVPDVVSYGGGRADRDASKNEYILAFTGANSADLTDGLQPNNFGVMQGTSQATPHVSGAFAQLYQMLHEFGVDKVQNMQWNAEHFRELLKNKYSYVEGKGYGLFDYEKVMYLFNTYFITK